MAWSQGNIQCFCHAANITGRGKVGNIRQPRKLVHSSRGANGLDQGSRDLLNSYSAPVVSGKKIRKRGHPMPLTDSLIAAIAKRHNLTLVTRNTADYAHTGLRVLNPFL